MSGQAEVMDARFLGAARARDVPEVLRVSDQADNELGTTGVLRPRVGDYWIATGREVDELEHRVRGLEDEVYNQPPLTRLQLLDLRPGDVVIATIPNDVFAKHADEIKHQLELRFPGHTVVVKPELVHLDFARDES